MLREFVNKLMELAPPTTLEVDGSVYSSKEMIHIQDRKPMPKCIDLTGLDSICNLILNEYDHIGQQIFVQAKDYKSVSVFTSLDSDDDRLYLYRCVADTPGITVGTYLPYDRAVIELRSLYIPSEGTAYLLNLLGSISNESRVTTSDNGVTQKVEAKTGIALNSMVEVKPRVHLQPFRTFLEVEQPGSEFLLRISDRGEIGLFPADGGVWKLEATRNIAAYFEERLKDLIEKGIVVVIR